MGHIFNSNKLLVKCIIKVKLFLCITCHAAAEQKEAHSQSTEFIVLSQVNPMQLVS